MVTPEELADQATVTDIRLDIQGEAAKLGNLLQVLVPRGGPLKGYVVLQYADAGQAAGAAAKLGGRSFAERIVGAEFGDTGTLSTAAQYA